MNSYPLKSTTTQKLVVVHETKLSPLLKVLLMRCRDNQLPIPALIQLVEADGKPLLVDVVVAELLSIDEGVLGALLLLD